MAENQTSELAQAIQEVADKASLLVREEIELAKAEMTEKASRLARGAAIGAAAGVFVVAGLIYLLHGVAWFIWQVTGTKTSYWLGFVIVAGALFLLATIAGAIARRAFKRATPPTPVMAIEEAQLIKETVSHPATAGGTSVTTTTNGRS
jgi:uncharacterized membrane protein YqjE